MNHNFYKTSDLGDIRQAALEACRFKNEQPPENLLKGKRLGMIFFNPSLRTRLSTELAAKDLGMDTIVIEPGKQSWLLEFEDGSIMNGATAEHIKDAAGVLGSYFDILAVRAFPSLKDKEEDAREQVFSAFSKYSGVPVINLESALRHPLQSLADLMTIEEHRPVRKPKIALTWAPHIKPLPQSVPTSFAETVLGAGYDLAIAHPEGYELDPSVTQGAVCTHSQEEALADADFVYVKSWCASSPFGKLPLPEDNWTVDTEKMQKTNQGRFMHCLPVRRNLVATDAVIDAASSLTRAQAHNRIFAARYVLQKITENFT